MSTAELDKLSREQLVKMEMLLKLRNQRIVFARDHHVSTEGIRMNLKYPHIKDLYNSISPHIVLQGSTQCMKSEWSIVDHLAAAFLGLSVFYVTPKYESRNAFVQNRINRVLDSVTEYKKYVKEGSFDNLTLKQFGKGVIKYVGSNVLSDFKEFPASILYVDEVDQCDQDNLVFAPDRMENSPFKFKRYIGNPIEKNKGINYHFLLSDRQEWFLPCRWCNTLQEYDWYKTLVDPILDTNEVAIDYILKDKEWHEEIGRDIHPLCPHCGGTLNPSDPDAQWKATAKSNIEGKHMSKLSARTSTLRALWREFKESIHHPIKAIRFHNSLLGVPYESSATKVTADSLEACSRDSGYNLVNMGEYACIPGDSSVGPCSMGVDVGNTLDVQIHESVMGRRKLVFAGKIKGIDSLYDLVLRYNVEIGVVDSLPDFLLVQEFQAASPCVIWLARVRGDGTDKKMSYDTANRIINVDRTELLDRGYSQVLNKTLMLPHNFKEIINGAYLREMILPSRKPVEDARSNLKYEWTKGEDHQRFADAFSLLASNLLDTSIINDVFMG